MLDGRFSGSTGWWSPGKEEELGEITDLIFPGDLKLDLTCRGIKYTGILRRVRDTFAGRLNTLPGQPYQAEAEVSCQVFQDLSDDCHLHLFGVWKEKGDQSRWWADLDKAE